MITRMFHHVIILSFAILNGCAGSGTTRHHQGQFESRAGHKITDPSFDSPKLEILTFEGLGEFLRYISERPEELTYTPYGAEEGHSEAQLLPTEFLAAAVLSRGEIETINASEWNDIVRSYDRTIRFTISLSEKDLQTFLPEEQEVDHYLNFAIWRDLYVVVGMDTIPCIHAIRNPGIAKSTSISADFRLPGNSSSFPKVDALVWDSGKQSVNELMFVRMRKEVLKFNINLP